MKNIRIFSAHTHTHTHNFTNKLNYILIGYFEIAEDDLPDRYVCVSLVQISLENVLSKWNNINANRKISWTK